MTRPVMTDEYLTREEAAVYCGVSLITIDRRLRDGVLPKHTSDLLPGRVLIPKAALDLLLRKRARTAARTGGHVNERSRHEGDQPTNS
jgi:excisionase family DNA binding protein